MRALWDFADMLGSFVHRFEQRAQSIGKGDIACAATKATRLFEIGLRKTAHRTFLRRRALLDLFRRANAEQQVGQRESSRVLHALFFRASITEIYLLHFALQN